MERQEPVHRLGRRPARRHRPGRGRPRCGAAPRARPAARRRAHLGAAPGDRDRGDLPGRHRPALAAGAPQLAAQRAALRRAAGQGQEGDPRAVRRGAVHALAPLVRRAAPADRRRRRVEPGRRPALRRPAAGADAAYGVPGRRGAPDAAVLVRRRHPRPAARPHRAGGRARQLAARAGQAPRRHGRAERGGAEHPHRHPAALRAGRAVAADHAGRRVPRPDAAAEAIEAVKNQGR